MSKMKTFQIPERLANTLEVYSDAFDMSESEVIRQAVRKYLGEESPELKREYLKQKKRMYEDLQDDVTDQLRDLKKRVESVREHENNRLSFYDVEEEEREREICERVERLVEVARIKGVDKAKEACGTIPRIQRYISPPKLWGRVEDRLN